MRKVTWDEVENLCQELAQRISKFQNPEYIYGVPRGGLIPATILSHIMGIPLLTDEDEAKEAMHYGAQVLVVDDINDTGKTMSEWRLWTFAQKVSLFERKGTTCQSDWAGEVIEHNGWLLMPWESQRRAFEDMADYLERRHVSHELATDTKS